MADMLRLAEARGFAFALLTPPMFYIVRRYIRRAKNLGQYLLACAAGVAPFMILYACIRWVILPPWSAALQRYVPRAGHSPMELIREGFADQITIYIAILVAAHAYEYFERARKQEMERYEYQQALAASELQALKMQLHPHFLFNTLHGISTLVDSDRDSAKAMIVKLSSLLRLNAFQETEPRCGSAVLVPAAYLAAVVAERVSVPFAASVVGAAAPFAVYGQHWPAVALLADAPAPAAARASDAPPAAARRASAAVVDSSCPLPHFQCLEAWAEDAAEDLSRGSESVGEERCFLGAQ